MIEIQNYPSFVLAIVVFQIIPGAGTIAILNATARGGISRAFGAVGGMLTGDLIMMSAAMAGLAAIVNARPLLFSALQYLGAAYLAWLGVQMLWQKVASKDVPKNQPTNHWAYYRQAMLVSLSNPKVMLFFMAFFPLFLTPGASLQTVVVIMLHVTISSFIYQTLLVLVGNAVAQKLRAFPLAAGLVSKGAGVILIGLGLELALNSGA